MAVAAAIKVKDIAPSSAFANIFARLEMVGDPLTLPELVAKWYYIDYDIVNYTRLCIELSGEIDQNVAVKIYRSTGHDTNNTDYAVPVPGGDIIMTPDVPGNAQRISVDFNVENVYWDRLWLRITPAAGIAGTIDSIKMNLKS